MLRAEAAPRMGLVAAGTGWIVQNQSIGASSDDYLFWTSDDGNNWKDITPRDPASRQIADVFFLDASRGWVLFAVRGKEFTGASNVSGFDLAITTDGGADWTQRHVTVPPENHGWSGGAKIFFLDSSHGWLNLELALHDWAVGTLLETTDGGQNWNPVQGFNVDAGFGGIRFVDTQNGWVAGGPYGQQHLYATHDGGRNWHDVALPPVSGLSTLLNSITMSQCKPPLFRDSKHGLLPVTYSGTSASGSDLKVLALFSTDDTGRTWRSEGWGNLGEDRGVLAFTAVDSQAFALKPSDHAALTLLKVGLGGKTAQTGATGMPQMSSNTALLSLRFGDMNHGWAFSSDSRLLSTVDGGVTWRDITPSRQKSSTLATSGSLQSGVSGGTLLQDNAAAPLASGPVAASSSSVTTYKSRHVGFDACTKPTTSQMGTWWSTSPYFDYGVYVGGVNTKCVSLTSSWVNTVTGQGWGLIPIWVGPQAACTCARGTWPNCTQTWTTISTTGGAYAQGQAEADAATGSKGMPHSGLGSGSPVYFDMENYSPDATCNGNPHWQLCEFLHLRMG